MQQNYVYLQVFFSILGYTHPYIRSGERHLLSLEDRSYLSTSYRFRSFIIKLLSLPQTSFGGKRGKKGGGKEGGRGREKSEQIKGKLLFPSNLTPPPAPSTNQYSPMLTQTYSSSNEVPHLFGDYLLKISSKQTLQMALNVF